MLELKPARLWRRFAPLTLMAMLSFAPSPVSVAVSPVVAPVTAAFAAAGQGKSGGRRHGHEGCGTADAEGAVCGFHARS